MHLRCIFCITTFYFTTLNVLFSVLKKNHFQSSSILVLWSGIPALMPIVEHVFMTSSSTSAWQVKTQRDVVVAMLLRLAEYPQVRGFIKLQHDRIWLGRFSVSVYCSITTCLGSTKLFCSFALNSADFWRLRWHTEITL